MARWAIPTPGARVTASDANSFTLTFAAGQAPVPDDLKADKSQTVEIRKIRILGPPTQVASNFTSDTARATIEITTNGNQLSDSWKGSIRGLEIQLLGGMVKLVLPGPSNSLSADDPGSPSSVTYGYSIKGSAANNFGGQLAILTKMFNRMRVSSGYTPAFNPVSTSVLAAFFQNSLAISLADGNALPLYEEPFDEESSFSKSVKITNFPPPHQHVTRFDFFQSSTKFWNSWWIGDSAGGVVPAALVDGSSNDQVNYLALDFERQTQDNPNERSNDGKRAIVDLNTSLSDFIPRLENADKLLRVTFHKKNVIDIPVPGPNYRGNSNPVTTRNSGGRYAYNVGATYYDYALLCMFGYMDSLSNPHASVGPTADMKIRLSKALANAYRGALTFGSLNVSKAELTLIEPVHDVTGALAFGNLSVAGTFDANNPAVNQDVTGSVALGNLSVAGTFNAANPGPNDVTGALALGNLSVAGTFDAANPVTENLTGAVTFSNLTVSGAELETVPAPIPTVQGSLDFNRLTVAGTFNAANPTPGFVPIAATERNFLVHALIDVSLPSGTIYLWTGDGSFTFGGNTYEPNSSLLKAGGLGGSVGSSIAANIEILLPKGTRRTEVISPIGSVKATVRFIGSINDGSNYRQIRVKKGIVTNPRLKGNRLTFNVSTPDLNVNRSRVQYWSNPDQQRRDPSDRALEGMQNIKGFEKTVRFPTI